MEINRRNFIVTAAVGLCGCLGGCDQSGSGGGSGSLDPADVEAQQKGTLTVGKPSDFPTDGAYGNFAESDRLIVVRKGAAIFAVSAVCTHRAKTCKPVGGGSSIACPAHGSRFDLDGTVVKGPADENLVHYAIAIGADGLLTVDKNRKLKATDPAASAHV